MPKPWEAAAIAIGLFAGGASIVFKDSPLLAVALISVAVLFVILPFIPRWWSGRIRLIFERDDARKQAAEICALAAREGGRLIGTNVRPGRMSAEDDFVLEQLAKAETAVRVDRFIFMEDRFAEDQLLRAMLTLPNINVSKTVHFIRRSEFVPTAVWSVFPRANILLYHNDRSYLSFLGLDHLRVPAARDRRNKTNDRDGGNNFAILFRSREVFDVLEKYFNQIKQSQFVDSASGIAQYLAVRKDAIDPQVHAIVVAMKAFAEDSAAVRHIGVFGSVAAWFEGRQAPMTEHESDLDLMVIVNKAERQNVQDRLIQLLDDLNYPVVVWGDYERYFYHFRPAGKVTVDIEVHEVDSDFYIEHPLLGWSIFSTYYSLYDRDDRTVRELVQLPGSPTTMMHRLVPLIRDRKGLEDFKRRLDSPNPDVDPRRVVSITLRNVAWALTGSNQSSIRSSMVVLAGAWPEIFPRTEASDVLRLLKLDSSSVRREWQAGIALARVVVEESLAWATAAEKRTSAQTA